MSLEASSLGTNPIPTCLLTVNTNNNLHTGSNRLVVLQIPPKTDFFASIFPRAIRLRTGNNNPTTRRDPGADSCSTETLLTDDGDSWPMLRSKSFLIAHLKCVTYLCARRVTHDAAAATSN